ncbi:hypothetical protein ACQPVP_15915 [Clostridium nigeriense]
MTTQELLEMAIACYGLDDIITKMLSIKRDKEIEIEQRLIYERYKQCIA